MSRDDGPPNAATLRERRRPPPRETGWPRSRESAGSHPPGPVAPWLGSAFGLVFACRRTVTGIAPHEGAIPADATVLAPESPAGAALRGRRLRRLDHADGRLGMTIDDLGERGYRIAAPGVASFRVSCDGLRVHVDEPARAQGWERLLVGQVLPLAAALRGCEPLHASAVSIGGRVLAIAGDSGAGKSTLAAHLALRGNPLLADDVLSLSLDSDGRPLAHRGASSLSLSRDRDELEHACAAPAWAWRSAPIPRAACCSTRRPRPRRWARSACSGALAPTSRSARRALRRWPTFCASPISATSRRRRACAPSSKSSPRSRATAP